MSEEKRIKRPTWTDDQLYKICQKACNALEWGANPAIAARSAGISPKSLKQIIDYGKENPEDKVYSDILLRIATAADQIDLTALEALKKAALRGHVRAAAEILRIRGWYTDADRAAAPKQNVIIKHASREDSKKES